MKLLKLKNYESKDDIDPYCYVNPLTITFVESSESGTYIYFGDKDSAPIHVAEDRTTVNSKMGGTV